jgi:SAM-dependent methyltransferase
LEHYPELAGFPLVDPNIIGDAESLVNVEDEKYDFLVSAHVIEHMRDPLSAIKQWCRVVKPGGLIYLIVPDKRYTFDKHRVRTTLEHMILDYVAPSRERDLEHYLDQAVHVNEKVGSEAVEFAREWEKIDYSIHFHVFLPSDMVNLLKWFSANISPIEIVEGPVKRPHYPRLRQATSEEMIESVGSQSHTKDTEDPEAEIKYNLGSDEFHLLIRRV